MDFDFEIYKGKKFSSLCKNIYENTEHKHKQINLFIADLHGLIKTVDDAIRLTPLIQEYLDVCVRNDEHLVKLAAVVQRFTNNTSKDSDGNLLLTEDDKNELLKSLEEVSNIEKDIEKINKAVEKEKNSE